MSITYAGTLDVIVCCECHMDFGMTPTFRRARERDHGPFYCPAGHEQYYPQESDVERARRETDKARRRAAAAEGSARRAREHADREARRAAAFKGVATKVKKRVGKGVCPCCNRSFENLRRHMTDKHPEWAPDE